MRSYGFSITLLLCVSCTSQLVENQLHRTAPPTGNRIVYYVSSDGDDENDGLRPERAWRTISRVNQVSLGSGTEVRFRAGDTFNGSFAHRTRACGNAARPISLTTFGGGRATIEAGLQPGISVSNCGGYQISNLALRGDAGNEHAGILFHTDLRGDVKLEHVVIDNVEVSGFRYGINLVSARGTTGYSGVRITNSRIHDNVRDGIRTAGEWNPHKVGWAHRDVHVAHNTVYNTSGDPEYFENHSGNGIILSDVDGATIEHNVAYNNGGRNGNTGGGPVGIWAWDCNDVTIQFNESYENHKAPDKHADDGDGFDLDGGCSNSVMQYNYAHDNDGAGFLVWQYEGARPKSNVTVRYNVSVNDGRKLGYGGITVGGEEMDGVLVHNNTVYMTRSPTGNGRESGIVIWGGHYDPGSIKKVRIFNNLFFTSGSLHQVWIESVGVDLQFAGNWYQSTDGHFRVRHPRTTLYESLDSWRLATEQEWINGSSYGSTGGSLLVNPGGPRAAAYRLQPVSPLRDRGLDLEARFGIDPGNRDYFGNPLPQGSGYEVGAHELEP